MEDERGIIAEIRPVAEKDVAAAQQVIFEGLRGCGYTISPELDPDFENLPGFYRGSGGELLVLELPGVGVAGTVAVLRHSVHTCILRRMYLDDRYRGHGLGRRLLNAAMAWAVEAGFRRMELETAPTMTVARRLYETAGFVCEGQTRRFGHCGVSYSRTL